MHISPQQTALRRKCTMEAWITHKQFIRRFNMAMAGLFFCFLAVASFIGGVRIAGAVFLMAVGPVLMILCMANAFWLVLTPRIDATDDEIRTAVASGPKWLKRLVSKLEAASSD